MRGWATVEDVIIFHYEVLFMLINLPAYSACYQPGELVQFPTSYPLFPAAFCIMYGNFKTPQTQSMGSQAASQGCSLLLVWKDGGFAMLRWPSPL